MAQVVISIAVSGDDGRSSRDGTTYPPTAPSGSGVMADSYVDAFKQFSTPTYTTDCQFLRFNTSVIPDDATVTAATLRLYSEALTNGDSRNVNFEWYPWTTISDADYVDVVGTTAAAVAVSAITGVGSNDFVLSDAAANVSKTGYTGIRYGISGGAPAGVNQVYFCAFDHATLAEPRLVVDYDLAPTFRFDTSSFPKAMMRSR